MIRYALELEYDGTPFVGWQRQPNGLSVQGVIEAALEIATGQSCLLQGAGRTDAGVHARAMAAHVDLAGDAVPTLCGYARCSMRSCGPIPSPF